MTTPREEGRRAYRDGLGAFEDPNPYDDGTSERDEWEAGWNEEADRDDWDTSALDEYITKHPMQ